MDSGSSPSALTSCRLLPFSAFGALATQFFESGTELSGLAKRPLERAKQTTSTVAKAVIVTFALVKIVGQNRDK